MDLFSHYPKAKAVELAQERQIPANGVNCWTSGVERSPNASGYLTVCLPQCARVATGSSWVV